MSMPLSTFKYDLMMKNIVQLYHDTQPLMETVRATIQDKPKAMPDPQRQNNPPKSVDAIILDQRRVVRTK
jgi:hypothetical protein